MQGRTEVAAARETGRVCDADSSVGVRLMRLPCRYQQRLLLSHATRDARLKFKKSCSSRCIEGY